MATKPADFKLRKNEILRGRIGFNNVFENGKWLSGKYCSVLYVKSDSRKIGFVVSNRIKRAVFRNRQKRLLREIFRLNKNSFPESFHIILLAKGITDNFSLLEQDVLKLLGKIEI